METDELGEVRLTYSPERLIPVAEYLSIQGRFKYVPEERVDRIQQIVGERMRKLGFKEGEPEDPRGRNRDGGGVD